MREFVYLAAVAAMAAVVSGDVPQVCPDDSQWHLPNPYDCTKYYQCYMGKTFEFPCYEDGTGQQLCFVEGHKTCGRWDDCSCIRDRACKSPEDDHKWMGSGYNNGYYQCKNGSVEWVPCKDNEVVDPTTLTCRPKSSGTCPPSGSGKLMPHHCLCQYYYECKDGKETSQKCPDGQLFDADLLACRSAKDARCNGKPSHCPKDGTFPSADSCHEYYICKNGVKTTHKCQAGLIFDNVKLLCLPWDKANCTTNGQNCKGWNGPRMPNKKDCNRYYECSNGHVTEGKCLENHYFNPLIQMCDLKENVECNDGKSSDDTDCPLINCGTIRFPHQNCEMYYQCKNGKKTALKCPVGLAYDKDTEMCDLPSKVRCSISGCTPGSLFPHQCQCDMYYVCTKEGDKVLNKCPSGKNFDEVTLDCTLPEYARCHKEYEDAPFSQTLSHWLY